MRNLSAAEALAIVYLTLEIVAELDMDIYAGDAYVIQL